MGICHSSDLFPNGPQSALNYDDPNHEEDLTSIPPFKVFYVPEGVFSRTLQQYAPAPYFIIRLLCSPHEDWGLTLPLGLSISVPRLSGGDPRFPVGPYVEYRMALLDYVNRTIGTRRGIFFFACDDTHAHFARAFEPQSVLHPHPDLTNGVPISYSCVVGDRSLWRFLMHLRGGASAPPRTVPFDSIVRPPTIGYIQIVPRLREPGRDTADSLIRVIGVSTSPLAPPGAPPVLPRAGYYEEVLEELSYASMEGDGCPSLEQCDGSSVVALAAALYAAFYALPAFPAYRPLLSLQ